MGTHHEHQSAMPKLFHRKRATQRSIMSISPNCSGVPDRNKNFTAKPPERHLGPLPNVRPDRGISSISRRSNYLTETEPHNVGPMSIRPNRSGVPERNKNLTARHQDFGRNRSQVCNRNKARKPSIMSINWDRSQISDRNQARKQAS